MSSQDEDLVAVMLPRETVALCREGLPYNGTALDYQIRGACQKSLKPKPPGAKLIATLVEYGKLEDDTAFSMHPRECRALAEWIKDVTVYGCEPEE